MQETVNTLVELGLDKMLPVFMEDKNELAIKKQKAKRTIIQNKSLHLGFTQVSKIANDTGLTMRAVIQDLDIPLTEEAVKIMYKAVAKAMYNVESTTELNTSQISEVWNAFIKPFEERTGEYMPFPSMTDSNDYYEELVKSI